MEFSFEISEKINESMGSIPGMKFFVFKYSKSRQNEILTFEKLINIKMPNSMIEFFKKTDGFSFKWEYQKENYSLYTIGEGLVLGINDFIYGLEYKFTGNSPKKGEKYKGYLWTDKDASNLIFDLENSYFVLDMVDNISYYYD